MDLSKLAEPFPADDIEWRVSRAGMGKQGIYCHVITYVTARAIQHRLDDVCGIDNWRNEQPHLVEFQVGRFAFVGGISIRINDEWITKWDVAEPTQERGGFAGSSAKGGFSGCMKRAACQFGVGRYLYHLTETRAEVSDSGGKGWNWARLPKDQGGGTYYWKPPALPGWALPKEPEHEVNSKQLNELKRDWRAKFCAESKDPAELREGFARFVVSLVGKFPVSDHACWTSAALETCRKRIEETAAGGGVDSDVPFGE